MEKYAQYIEGNATTKSFKTENKFNNFLTKNVSYFIGQDMNDDIEIASSE